MPLGFPVVPDVYRMNSGCSASNASGVCSGDCPSTASCHHLSRESSQATSWPVRRTTSTCSTIPARSTASSTAGLSADGLPRRYPPSAVMTTRASASWIRVARASEEKPPKTTECAAPMRAQASIAIAVSGIIGM